MAYLWKIGAGDDCVHTFDCGSRFRIDRLDACMCVRAAQHFAEQHARQTEVGAEIRATRDLVDTIGAYDAGADDLELSRFAHDASPRNVCAAS